MPLRHEPTEENLTGEHPVLVFKFWVSDFVNENPDDEPDPYWCILNPDSGWADAVFTPELAREVAIRLIEWAASQDV